MNPLRQTVKSGIEHLTVMRIFISAVFAILFSQAIVAGTEVHYMEMRSGIAENYITYDWKCIAQGILLAVILLPITILLFEICDRHGLKTTDANDNKSNNFFFISWGIVFICYIPYLLTFYPGGMVGDGGEVLRMALSTGLPTSSHWSVFYVLLLRAVIKLGNIISDDLNNCIFLYAVIESMIYSSICACLCAVIHKKLSNIRFIAYFITIMFAFSGFFATYSMTFWADGMFGASIVLLCMILWNSLDKDEIRLSELFSIFACLLFICLWRNNGIYITAVVCVGILVILKKSGIKIVCVCIAAFIITSLITGPIYTSLGIRSDSSRESISIPIQQIASVINYGGELSSEQKAVLYQLAPGEIWTDNYCPTLSDNIKFKINQEYLEEHFTDFMKIWVQLLSSNFGTYVRAYLMQTLGFWKLDSFQGFYSDYWYGVEDNYDFGLYEKDLFETYTGVSIRSWLIDSMKFIPSGTAVWILVFSFFGILYQGKDYKRLIILLPIIGCWLTVMVATPIAFAYRYIHALAMMLPVVVLLPLFHNKW